jgi:hypothetical protein
LARLYLKFGVKRSLRGRAVRWRSTLGQDSERVAARAPGDLILLVPGASPKTVAAAAPDLSNHL